MPCSKRLELAVQKSYQSRESNSRSKRLLTRREQAPRRVPANCLPKICIANFGEHRVPVPVEHVTRLLSITSSMALLPNSGRKKPEKPMPTYSTSSRVTNQPEHPRIRISVYEHSIPSSSFGWAIRPSERTNSVRLSL